MDYFGRLNISLLLLFVLQNGPEAGVTRKSAKLRRLGVEVMAKVDSAVVDSCTCHGPNDLTCEVGLLSKPDGSATLSTGDTCVLAAVYGPVEVKMSRELVDRASVDVVYKCKVGQSGCAEKFQERLVCNTCETVILTSLHPRTSINVILQEMQDSGSLLASSINAAYLAMLDACIPLKCLVAAVSCIVTDKGELLLDPTKKQESSAPIHMTFAFDSKDYKVLTASTAGAYSNEQFQQCMLVCREASKRIFTFYRNSVARKVSRQSTTN